MYYLISSWIRIHQFLWIFFIGKVKWTKQNSEALNKPRDILKISVFKRLCIVNLLIAVLNNHELFSDKLKNSSVDWFRILFVKAKQIRFWHCASSLFGSCDFSSTQNQALPFVDIRHESWSSSVRKVTHFLETLGLDLTQGNPWEITKQHCLYPRKRLI